MSDGITAMGTGTVTLQYDSTTPFTTSAMKLPLHRTATCVNSSTVTTLLLVT
jgi:hypothetical protein